MSSKLSSKANGQKLSVQTPFPNSAAYALGNLTIKTADPHDGYNRNQFGSGWALVDGCDMREQILNRDLSDAKIGLLTIARF